MGNCVKIFDSLSIQMLTLYNVISETTSPKFWVFGDALPKTGADPPNTQYLADQKNYRHFAGMIPNVCREMSVAGSANAGNNSRVIYLSTTRMSTPASIKAPARSTASGLLALTAAPTMRCPWSFLHCLGVGDSTKEEVGIRVEQDHTKFRVARSHKKFFK